MGYNLYAWSNGANTQQIYAANSGTYSVTVTDANGCTAEGIITIEEADELTVTLEGEDVSCNAGADGSASAVANLASSEGWIFILPTWDHDMAPLVTPPIINTAIRLKITRPKIINDKE